MAWCIIVLKDGCNRHIFIHVWLNNICEDVNVFFGIDMAINTNDWSRCFGSHASPHHQTASTSLDSGPSTTNFVFFVLPMPRIHNSTPGDPLNLGFIGEQHMTPFAIVPTQMFFSPFISDFSIFLILKRFFLSNMSHQLIFAQSSLNCANREVVRWKHVQNLFG